MTTHISDDLPRLLTGDANREVVMEAATHLRSCVDCQQELVSAVVAHASLTSAHKFAPEIVAPGRDLDDHDDAPVPTRLPDLSDVFAEVRAEATVTPIKVGRTRRRLAAVAAAAAIVVGGGVSLAVVQSGDSGPSTRTVALKPFSSASSLWNTGKHEPKVTIVGNNKLKVDATSLKRLDRRHLYEVWLTNDTRDKMQSVGFIGDDNTAELSVSPKWMSQYNDIEISVQKVNQDGYSGVSVLRGAYG